MCDSLISNAIWLMQLLSMGDNDHLVRLTVSVCGACQGKVRGNDWSSMLMLV